MCGFAGFIEPGSAFQKDRMAFILQQMTDRIAHRGPDDSGIWIDQERGIALGHRRLSIIDLSPEGHQPMVSACGRYVIVFNGEIYNYQDIKKELIGQNRGLVWRGHSDTEVMLAAISTWGLVGALERFNGMFAFAVWDKREQALSLVRDRVGEKPLYYGESNNIFLFGSELKSLCAHPSWNGEIDRKALSLFMRNKCIPAPYSIYSKINKVLPGRYVTFKIVASELKEVANESYWSAKKIVESGSSNFFHAESGDLVDQLDSLLSESIKIRMEADVPLGAFLSGGVDSSLVAALMQKHSSSQVKTFSIGFHEERFNEAEHAAAVARHLNTVHTELYVSPKDSISVIPELPSLYDEPFSDSSQIPTFLVSKMAKEHITVALSGDGGDELFGGYTRYLIGMNLWNIIGRLPAPARLIFAKMIFLVKPKFWRNFFHLIEPLTPSRLRQRHPTDKILKLADLMLSRTPEQLYRSLISHWQYPEEVVINGAEPKTILSDPSQWPELNNFAHFMMYQDLVGYLPDDILTKVDRASMGASLEVRVPLLDHRLVEFAWQLPLDMKVREGEGKWLLRQVLYKYVPKHMIDRPKKGFAVPIGEWLKGPLRDWAEQMLSDSRIRQEGYLVPETVARYWKEHLSGLRDRQYHLWDILMFNAWLDETKSATLFK